MALEEAMRVTGHAGRDVLAAVFGPAGQAAPKIPNPGDIGQVYSESQKSWIPARVMEVKDNLITMGYAKDGVSMQKQLPLGHPSLRLNHSDAASSSSALGYGRGYPKGETGRRLPEPLTLYSLFAWVDTDKSGKISQHELQQALPLLEQLQGEPLRLSEESWEALDEDGNGAVNFMEFAQWAGPRLGLPLGVEHLFGASGREPACGVMGCPCEGYRPSADCGHAMMNFGKKKKKKDKKDKKHKKGESFLDCDWEDWLSDTIGGALSPNTSRFTPCMCGHKQMVHHSTDRGSTSSDVPFPRYWKHRLVPGRTDIKEIVELPQEQVALFQHLLNNTYSNVWTRDRKKHSPDHPNVPRAYRVVRAFRAENSKNWKEYCIRRAGMLRDVSTSSVPVFNAKSADEWERGASMGVVGEPLARGCNEWFLFHGTSPQAALSICQGDFRISLAGGSTGTLYGRGTYFAESITKADEYAKEAGGEHAGEFAVLLVRALGGRVRYTDEVEPEAEDLTRSCIEGPYDCVLGDRQKCRGTYREFIFFDTENLYAEYVIIYRRQY
eukprot:TRINITY_DN102043_c0_g1_i1.p1 TRINITY_DN102043_c0_g1~~TRINITY_DN102043_c0_g1_i1.p1  ORF type:complete len:562 (+),score=79.16 TRINITY_DN102043_c0_g1_i1:32-1687(+)